MKEKLWVEHYRPRFLNDYAFQNENLKKIFTQYVEDGTFPHLLLVGVQGTGKTTLANVLVNELQIDKFDVLRINASQESGIDVIRERVVDFCSTFPSGDFKVVILDEADGISPHAQRALRGIIEQYSDTVRFIFTANYVHKIIPALQSRLQTFVIDQFDDDSIIDYVSFILEDQAVDVPNPDYVFDHIERYAPDLRKIVNSIQQSTVNGILGPVTASSGGSDAKDEWEAIWRSTPSYDALQPLVKYVDESNYEDFYRVMYDNVDKLGEKALSAIPVIAEHLYKGGVVVDQEINLSACLVRIFMDLGE